jgi:hypothetical protein
MPCDAKEDDGPLHAVDECEQRDQVPSADDRLLPAHPLRAADGFDQPQDVLGSEELNLRIHGRTTHHLLSDSAVTGSSLALTMRRQESGAGGIRTLVFPAGCNRRPHAAAPLLISDRSSTPGGSRTRSFRVESPASSPFRPRGREAPAGDAGTRGGPNRTAFEPAVSGPPPVSHARRITKTQARGITSPSALAGTTPRHPVASRLRNLQPDGDRGDHCR